MKISKLIKKLKKVKDQLGNVEVAATSYCGTNTAHVHFNLNEMESSVEDYVNGNGEFCLSMEVSKSSKDRIIEGISDMKKRGYTYYRSQFVENKNKPEKGLSTCDWHSLW